MAQEKTILESIREYLTTCPVFSGSVIHKDYLPDGEAIPLIRQKESQFIRSMRMERY